jgi:titin
MIADAVFFIETSLLTGEGGEVSELDELAQTAKLVQTGTDAQDAITILQDAAETTENAANTAEEIEGGLLPTLEGNVPNPVKWTENGGSVSYGSDGTITYTLQDGTAVTYNQLGYPDFSPYLYAGSGGLSQVRITLTGSRYWDEIAANAAAGFEKTPIGYTWHHNEDVGLMQLVEEEVHGSFWHSGGFSLNNQ